VAEEAPAGSDPLVVAIDRCLADPGYQAYFADAEPGADEYDDEAAEEEAAMTLAELCPEVIAGVEASSLGAYLTADWADWAPQEKLERLKSQLVVPAPAGTRRPDPGAVAAIVERMQAATAAPQRSLWARFKDWVRSLIGERSADAQSGWLSEWLQEHLPLERTITLVLYVLLASLVGAIGWVVYSELWTPGLLRRRPGLRAVSAVAESAAPGAPSLAGASESEAPSILVTLLIGELRRLGRVEDRLSMTHRELGRAARFDAAADGATFDRVLGAAERLRYASSPPASEVLRSAIDAGRGLLDRLARLPRGAT